MRPTARYVFDFDAPPRLWIATSCARLVGGKAANLMAMANELGLPVPPGFVVTTEACNAFLAGEWPAGLDDELRDHMDRLGERLGRRFGDADDPLLCQRSIRRACVDARDDGHDPEPGVERRDCARGWRARPSDSEFAADCLARFREGYRAVIGTDSVPDDPWQQLRTAVEAVFRSWQSDRARAYRAREGIADDLGTAVTVQAMVFGNLDANSGTGVRFHAEPVDRRERAVRRRTVQRAGRGRRRGHARDAADCRARRSACRRLRTSCAATRTCSSITSRTYATSSSRSSAAASGCCRSEPASGVPRAALRMAIDMAEDGRLSPVARGGRAARFCAARRSATRLRDGRRFARRRSRLDCPPRRAWPRARS